jgi:DNA-binding response OmpR family regulator
MEQPIRILVVDDDQPILLLMKSVLREFGFTPILASSGADALAMAAEEPPQLILLDWRMPGISGDVLVRKFREDLHLGSIPILILSGEPLSPDQVRELGAEGSIQKPFDLHHLISEIRHYIGTRSEREASV